MRPPILILLALGITGCAAERANSMAFELAATSRALEHELATNQAWASEVTTYVDDEGDDLVVALPSEALPPAEASTEVVEGAMELATLDITEEPAAPVLVVQAPPQSPPAPVDSWSAWSDPTVTSGAALGGSNTLALLNLTRAIDEHRQTLVMEARLEDKQRLIDQLRADVDGVSTGTSRSGGAARAQQESAAARAELAKAGEALAEKEQARVELEARLGEAQVALEESRTQVAAVEASLAELAARADEQGRALAASEQAQQQAVAEARSEAEVAERVLRTELDARVEQLAGTEAAYRELLVRYEGLSDEKERERERVELRRQKRQDRWDRWTWRKGRADGNREATREDRRLREQALLEEARLDAQRATAQAAIEEDASAAESQIRQAEIERARLAELAALSAAKVSELEAANAAIVAEREDLLAKTRELELGRAQLEESLHDSEQRQVELREHVAALQRAEEAAGFMDESRQAEIRDLEYELDTLMAQEQELERVQAELAGARSREAALVENQAEVESLRARALEAEGMEAELAKLQAQRKERDEAWSATLAPIVDIGLEVKRQGNVAQILVPSDGLFPSGSASLSDGGRARILAVGAVLASHPELHVAVEGHTDSQGANRANWDLAYARARNTLEALESAGVAPARISAASYGEHRPVASNDTAEGRAANRRIELVLTIVEE